MINGNHFRIEYDSMHKWKNCLFFVWFSEIVLRTIFAWQFGWQFSWEKDGISIKIWYVQKAQILYFFVYFHFRNKLFLIQLLNIMGALFQNMHLNICLKHNSLNGMHIHNNWFLTPPSKSAVSYFFVDLWHFK